ncbi:zinc finger B-box domain-containing protein 1 isoform X1 [Anolis carolinensis]|uniref:B box-type domain-containing protein n=1 Tax=Anolis carolinensis TaxID=28377 RepID=G1KXG8_ANOCA|nr:PREDICTED: zinc finger B-box domain-containing protein 1 isoform X2 [Anolis carolinensis]|eukprot:XP_008104283.1 PREDICTED: zinc finger B-box domain-containing protein 1 isoform X2 [Anolis carolinensis]
MNANDFVILPGSKTGVSAKLKAKSMRELQLEKVRLELENQEMEKKLQQLQLNMSREKQEREQANRYHWKSGQAGVSLQPQLLSQNKENVGKISSGKVKLRVLKEQIQVPEPAKQTPAHKLVNVSTTEKPRVKGKACGQCEMKTALLVCLECGENYCPACFARVHQKGALKLHRTTPLKTKTHVSVGKLEAAQNFLKTIHDEHSNGWINNEQNKETSEMLEDTLDLPSPLQKVPTFNIEEASRVPSSEIRCDSQSGGSLFHGTYDEEESAKSFQEALNQWRNGNCSQKSKEERSCQVGSENSGTCQVQTSPPLVKKPIEIEFKEDSLKYMERLLIKKHRRTPVDKLPDSIIADELKLEKTLPNETPNSWVGEDNEDDEIASAHFAAEEMKKYWRNVFIQEEPEIDPVHSEPSLKIKILEDAYQEEIEESTNFVVMEAGSDELIDSSGAMSKSHKTEPDIFLAQTSNITTRSPLSSSVRKEKCLTFLRNKCEETLRARTPFSQFERAGDACGCSGAEEMLPSTPLERTITKEKCAKKKKSSSCMSSEQTFSPLKLAPAEPFAAVELPKDCKTPMELNEASPLAMKSSVFLKVARREKPIHHPYQGLEGFFTVGTSCQQVMMDSFPSPYIGRRFPSSNISFSGTEKWMQHLSLGECSDECVVQDVLKMEQSRPLSRCGRQSPSPRASFSVLSMGSASPKPFSANIPIKYTFCTPSVLEAWPKSSDSLPLSRAASEISEIEGIDISELDDPSWEYSIDQKALADLADEFQSNSDPLEKLNGLTSGDFNRQSRMTYQNLLDFYNNHEINNYSKGDAIRICDESHTDDEEDQRDKQEMSLSHNRWKVVLLTKVRSTWEASCDLIYLAMVVISTIRFPQQLTE